MRRKFLSQPVMPVTCFQHSLDVIAVRKLSHGLICQGALKGLGLSISLTISPTSGGHIQHMPKFPQALDSHRDRKLLSKWMRLTGITAA